MEIEKRMEKIEKVIGNWKDSPEFASITTTLDYIYQISQYLNPMLLAEKTKSIEDFLNELKKSLGQKADLKIEANKGEIDRLYKMCKTALEYYPILPHIVEKMHALKYLYEQSAGIINKINAIEQAQVTIKTSLKEAVDLIIGAKKNFKNNLATIEGNLRVFDERLRKLTTK